MKILYINAVCGVGSTGRIVADLMKEAKEKGNIVKIACSTIEPVRNVNPEEVIIVGSKLDYYIHNALSRITDHEGLYSKAATKKLIKQIREYNPDLVHLHNLHGHWINYELLFRFLADENKKVIWTLHDCWAFTGHCSHFTSYGCDKWKTECYKCRGIKGYPRCYGKGDVSRNYSRKKDVFTALDSLWIVTPSEWLAGIVRQSFFRNHQVKSIPNGIDINIYRPVEENSIRDKYGLKDKIIILGVANVWSNKKGLKDFIELRKLLDDNYCILLVGLTESQIANLPNGILGIHRTSNIKELVEIYSTADIFVNPSYEETMGLVTVEAIACGTPAVVYDQTAVPEIIDEWSGITVSAGDINMLYDGILTILHSKEKYSQCRKRGELYDKRVQYEKYLSLYEKVFNN